MVELHKLATQAELDTAIQLLVIPLLVDCICASHGVEDRTPCCLITAY